MPSPGITSLVSSSFAASSSTTFTRLLSTSIGISLAADRSFIALLGEVVVSDVAGHILTDVPGARGVPTV